MLELCFRRTTNESPDISICCRISCSSPWFASNFSSFWIRQELCLEKGFRTESVPVDRLFLAGVHGVRCPTRKQTRSHGYQVLKISSSFCRIRLLSLSRHRGIPIPAESYTRTEVLPLFDLALCDRAVRLSPAHEHGNQSVCPMC